VESKSLTDTQEEKEEEKKEGNAIGITIDSSKPLGQLIVELNLLQSLSDGDLVSVAYDGGQFWSRNYIKPILK